MSSRWFVVGVWLYAILFAFSIGQLDRRVRNLEQQAPEVPFKDYWVLPPAPPAPVKQPPIKMEPVDRDYNPLEPIPTA